jgi:alkylresorcinol/alkylpyrone synthase
MTQPHMLALATAVPPYELHHPEVRRRFHHLFSRIPEAEIDRLIPVFDNAGIETRYSCVPVDWYENPPGWKERNQIYIDSALDLLETVTRQCLDQARLRPDELDAIVVVSTTGIATPSLDALLIERMGLRRDIERLPIFGLGCGGGVLGLARAGAIARLNPGSRVLCLVVELCALCFRRNDYSKSNVIATALFGDGAAGAIVSSRGDGPRLGASGQHTWPQTLDIMGWDVESDGFRAIMSRDIPSFVGREMRPVTVDFLARNGLGLGDIDSFVCHPGGTKVLIALEEAFGLAEGTLRHGKTVLRDYGNMSSATVFFVLQRMLAEAARGRLLMTAMGPGFTAGFQLLDA